MGVQRNIMPPWLVALLVVVPCSAFPRAGRLTNDEIHQHVREKGSAKTRVDAPEECDREKCPKMMDICPEGGHCFVTGDCADDGCLCTIKVACKDEQEQQEGSEDQATGDADNDEGSENQEPSEPEAGSDYSDDEDEGDEHQHHKGKHENGHVSCLKNHHNESYCTGWMKQRVSRETGNSAVTYRSGAGIGRPPAEQSLELVKIISSQITTVAVGGSLVHRKDTIIWNQVVRNHLNMRAKTKKKSTTRKMMEMKKSTTRKMKEMKKSTTRKMKEMMKAKVKKLERRR